jgi:hypothetical protein
MAKQCSVLYITPTQRPTEHTCVLLRLGFVVRQISAWPEDDRASLDFEAVVVHVQDWKSLPEIAARLRAKPKFGRRILLALTAPDTPASVRRDAKASGFDDVLSETADGKAVAAHILKALRQRPEFRCGIPRRAAA